MQGVEAGEIVLRTWGNSFALGKAFYVFFHDFSYLNLILGHKQLISLAKLKFFITSRTRALFWHIVYVDRCTIKKNYLRR